MPQNKLLKTTQTLEEYYQEQPAGVMSDRLRYHLSMKMQQLQERSIEKSLENGSSSSEVEEVDYSFF